MYRKIIIEKENVAVGAQWQPDAPLKRREYWPPESTLYALREYVQAGNTNLLSRYSDKEFDIDGKEKTIMHKELYKKCSGFLESYENRSKDYQERYKDEYIDMLNLWNTLEGNKGEDWPPEKTLYALREYVQAGNTNVLSQNRDKEFSYTDIDGKEKTIAHGKLRNKCDSFLKNYEKSSKDYQERYKDIYVDMLNLWNNLRGNKGESWPSKRTLYVLREYIQAGNAKIPLQHSNKNFSYTDIDSKEKTITHGKLYEKCTTFLIGYRKYSKDYQEKYKKDEYVYIDMLNLWNTLEGNKGEDWPPEKTLYALREYLQAGNTNRPLKSSDKEFSYTDIDDKEKTLTHKELYGKCYTFLRNYKKNNSKDYQERYKEIYIDMLNLWNSLKSKKRLEQNSNARAAYPHAKKSKNSRHLGSAKYTGQKRVLLSHEPRRIINYANPLSVGTAILNGRFEKDRTNIANPRGLDTDTTPKHDLQYPSERSFTDQEAVETTVYADIRDLLRCVESKTNFHKTPSRRKTPRDPEIHNAVPKLHKITEAEDLILKLSEKTGKEDSDLLLAAYEVSAAEPYNIEKAKALMDILKDLKIKYDEDLRVAYWLVFNAKYKDISNCLNELLDAADSKSERYSLIKETAHRLDVLKMCDRYHITRDTGDYFSRSVRFIRINLLKLLPELQQTIASEAEKLIND
ncbi:hypothetical protein NO1_0501 [Candidatus Termititenax aidoneus]|uniref:Uncharacterized protein n=1 Tax=Termititenax aidoneus TaxID=2218524 RepID=A0A388TA14_TERA1|nr:hypothetical protein NO1_0501 [Candidatus Termititenax aidoneus]